MLLMMIKKFVFTIFLSCLMSGLAFGQMDHTQEAIKDSYFIALGHLSENLFSDADASLVPSDTALIADFLLAKGIDHSSFFDNLRNVASAIEAYAEGNSIDLSSPNAYELIFDGVTIDLPREEMDSEISGPTLCYDRFVQDMQKVVVNSVHSWEGNVKAAALIYLAGGVEASIQFDKCIEENY